MFCGERPGIRPLSLVWRLVSRGTTKLTWPQVASGFVTLTHQARQAVYLACQAWRIGPGDEVLFPAYSCGTELDPILRTGATVVPYRVDQKARIDVEDIRRRASSRTRLVYVTHYFGWPQELKELVNWTRSSGIHVLEDCALSLFSAGSDAPLGSAGDAAVYSMPKSLAVPDGGLLVTRDESVRLARPVERPHGIRITWRTLSLVKTHMIQSADACGIYTPMRRGHAAESEPRPVRPDMPASYYFDVDTASWRASRVTERIALGVEIGEIVKKRRENFYALRDALSPAAAAKMLAAGLPDGVCPLAFPLLVHHRASWVAALHERGVMAVAWWAGYHRSLDWEEFPEACYLKDHLLTLPIHQDLSVKHMKYIGHCVNEIAAGMGSAETGPSATRAHVGAVPPVAI